MSSYSSYSSSSKQPSTSPCYSPVPSTSRDAHCHQRTWQAETSLCQQLCHRGEDCLYVQELPRRGRLQVLATDQAPATAVRLKQPAVEDREDRAVTRRDVRLIMPTLLILLFTILVIMTVIPYAFSSVIKQVRMMMSELRIRTTHSSLNVQLHAVQAMEAIKVSGGWRWRMSSFFSKNCPQQEMGLFKGILHPWTRKSHHHNKNI